MTGAEIAPYIDHTLLKADAAESEICRLCEEAMQYRFASVCVNGAFVPVAAGELRGSGIRICSVVGFPLGAMASGAKAFEAALAVRQGAEEVDMVISVGRLLAGDEDYILADIRAVVEAVQKKALVKVILETCLLSGKQKITACCLAENAGADFVKTSTGFSSGGATAEDVMLLRKTVGHRLGVKASGGIRTRRDAEIMISAGADRLGASASVAICSE